MAITFSEFMKSSALSKRLYYEAQLMDVTRFYQKPAHGALNTWQK